MREREILNRTSLLERDEVQSDIGEPTAGKIDLLFVVYVINNVYML